MKAGRAVTDPDAPAVKQGNLELYSDVREARHQCLSACHVSLFVALRHTLKVQHASTALLLGAPVVPPHSPLSLS